MEDKVSRTVVCGDGLTCPNCNGHRVRWIPYPKKEFGSMFILWIVFSLIMIRATMIIFAVGVVYWSVALVIRIRQNSRAKLVTCMHCDTCGTNFEVDNAVFQKGGNGI